MNTTTTTTTTKPSAKFRIEFATFLEGAKIILAWEKYEDEDGYRVRYQYETINDSAFLHTFAETSGRTATYTDGIEHVLSEISMIEADAIRFSVIEDDGRAQNFITTGWQTREVAIRSLDSIIAR